MPGGELFDRIVDQGHYTEGQARLATCKLLSAMKYMHDKGIAHRDLKPENMLMTAKGKNAEIKITDFGLGKFFDAQSSMMKTPCGTPGYIAPEVLQMRGYDEKCDVWSLGVIIYILLCGFPPFYADNDAQLFERIKKGKYEFIKPYWDPVSEQAKNFVRRMLVVEPKKRPTCEELLEDPWLAPCKENVDISLDEWYATHPDEPPINTPTELPKTTAAMKKLKGAFLTAFLVNAMSSSDD